MCEISELFWFLNRAGKNCSCDESLRLSKVGRGGGLDTQHSPLKDACGGATRDWSAQTTAKTGTGARRCHWPADPPQVVH